jgi:hypothetical protein
VIWWYKLKRSKVHAGVGIGLVLAMLSMLSGQLKIRYGDTLWECFSESVGVTANWYVVSAGALVHWNSYDLLWPFGSKIALLIPYTSWPV